MRFSVKKVEVLIFSLFFVLFTSLGVWQVNRAAEKRSIEKQINTRASDQALVLKGPVDWDPQHIEYQKIRVEGEFLPAGQILIDNILVGGQPGYHVVTPLKIAGSKLHILVNRGWVAQGATRQQLPEVKLPPGRVMLEGLVRTPSALPFVESSSVPLSMSTPFHVWLYLDLKKYEHESSLEIVPFAMLQHSDTGDGLRREWPAYKAKVAMHIGYALQWFAFSIIVSLIFFGVGRKRGKAIHIKLNPD